MMPPPITADILSQAATVVFDLDGTLIDSAYDVALAYCRALSAFGFEPPPPEPLQIGPPAETMVRDMIGKDVDETMIADIVSEFRRYYGLSDYPATKLYPGAAELLKRLKDEGSRLFIATYKRFDLARRVLEIKGIAGFFDDVLSVERGGERWTKHRMLTYIMETTQTPPAKTFFFGDSISDIQAGCDLGVQTVAVLYGYGTPAELLALQPDFVCENLELI